MSRPSPFWVEELSLTRAYALAMERQRDEARAELAKVKAGTRHQVWKEAQTWREHASEARAHAQAHLDVSTELQRQNARLQEALKEARAIARQHQERLKRIRDHALSEFDRADSEEKAQAWFWVMNDAQVDDTLPWAKDAAEP